MDLASPAVPPLLRGAVAILSAIFLLGFLSFVFVTVANVLPHFVWVMMAPATRQRIRNQHWLGGLAAFFAVGPVPYWQFATMTAIGLAIIAGNGLGFFESSGQEVPWMGPATYTGFALGTVVGVIASVRPRPRWIRWSAGVVGVASVIVILVYSPAAAQQFVAEHASEASSSQPAATRERAPGDGVGRPVTGASATPAATAAAPAGTGPAPETKYRPDVLVVMDEEYTVVHPYICLDGYGPQRVGVEILAPDQALATFEDGHVEVVADMERLSPCSHPQDNHLLVRLTPSAGMKWLTSELPAEPATFQVLAVVLDGQDAKYLAWRQDARSVPYVTYLVLVGTDQVR